MSVPGSFNFCQQQLTPWEHSNEPGITLFTPSTLNPKRNIRHSIANTKETQKKWYRAVWRTNRHWIKDGSELVVPSNNERKVSTLCDSFGSKKRVNTLNTIDVGLEPAIISRRREQKKKFILNFFKKQRESTSTHIKLSMPVTCQLPQALCPEVDKYTPSHNSVPLSSCSQPLWKRQKHSDKLKCNNNMTPKQNKSMMQVKQAVTPAKTRSFSIFI